MNKQEKILKMVFDEEYRCTWETEGHGTCVFLFARDENEKPFDFEFDCAVTIIPVKLTKKFPAEVEFRDYTKVQKVEVLRAKYNDEPFELNDMRFDTEELLRFGIEGDLNEEREFKK